MSCRLLPERLYTCRLGMLTNRRASRWAMKILASTWRLLEISTGAAEAYARACVPT